MGKKNNGCYYIIFQTTVAVIASVTYQAVLKKKNALHGSGMVLSLHVLGEALLSLPY